MKINEKKLIKVIGIHLTYFDPLFEILWVFPWRRLVFFYCEKCNLVFCLSKIGEAILRRITDHGTFTWRSFIEFHKLYVSVRQHVRKGYYLGGARNLGVYQTTAHKKLLSDGSCFESDLSFWKQSFWHPRKIYLWDIGQSYITL